MAFMLGLLKLDIDSGQFITTSAPPVGHPKWWFRKGIPPKIADRIRLRIYNNLLICNDLLNFVDILHEPVQRKFWSGSSSLMSHCTTRSLCETLQAMKIKLLVNRKDDGPIDVGKALQFPYPIPSMYDIFTYIWWMFMVNVVKYTMDGCYGICIFMDFVEP